ncbi:hypothetical protein Syun_011896 [Stephania yunnanensis]|uniref:Uncharacterized protein n=1 Tax=Stephania yunnanensis TaxID=152371 RepID=A0AAP0PIX8_9MAGN
MCLPVAKSPGETKKKSKTGRECGSGVEDGEKMTPDGANGAWGRDLGFGGRIGRVEFVQSGELKEGRVELLFVGGVEGRVS